MLCFKKNKVIMRNKWKDLKGHRGGGHMDGYYFQADSSADSMWPPIWFF